MAIAGEWFSVDENKTLTVRAVRKGKDLVVPIPEGMWVCFQGDKLVAIYQPDSYQGLATLYASADAIAEACTPLPPEVW